MLKTSSSVAQVLASLQQARQEATQALYAATKKETQQDKINEGLAFLNYRKMSKNMSMLKKPLPLQRFGSLSHVSRTNSRQYLDQKTTHDFNHLHSDHKIAGLRSANEELKEVVIETEGAAVI